MSVTWGERPNSLRVSTNPQSIAQGYVLRGTSDRAVAQALAAGYSVAIYGGLYRQNIACDRKGPDLWDVDVTWGPYEKKQQEEGDFKWSFSTTGATKHITQAISHVEEYGTSTTDHKGTIGLTEDGSVEGVDVIDHAFEWSEDWTLAIGSYGWTYSQILAALTGTVNNGTFRGFDAGTVLFKGAEGSQSIKDPLLLQVSYRFAYSPNATGLTVGDITSIAKGGHEYLWVEYRTEDPGGGAVKLPKRPSQVNVEKVYQSADFSLLGIGTT